MCRLIATRNARFPCTALVAPMTTGSRPAPFRIAADFAGKSGLIVRDQIRALDKSRLIKRLGEIKRKALTLPLQAYSKCLPSNGNGMASVTACHAANGQSLETPAGKRY